MQSDSNRITEEELAELEGLASRFQAALNHNNCDPANPCYPECRESAMSDEAEMKLKMPTALTRLIAEVRRLRVAIETVTKKPLMVSMDGQTMPLEDYEKFLRGHDVGNTSIPAVTNPMVVKPGDPMWPYPMTPQGRGDTPADGECGVGESK